MIIDKHTIDYDNKNKWHTENVHIIINNIIEKGLTVLKSKNLRIDSGVLAMAVFESSYKWSYSETDNSSYIVILGIKVPTVLRFDMEKDQFMLIDEESGNSVEFKINLKINE